MTSEGSDTPTLEEIAGMDVEEDILDSLRYGHDAAVMAGRPEKAVWTGTVDDRVSDVTDGLRPDWSIAPAAEYVVTDVTIETDAINDAVEKIHEKQEELARERLKGQTNPFIVRGSERVRERLRYDADATIRMVPETYECGSCYTRRPVMVVREGDFGDAERLKCFGECRETTRHVRTGHDWDPTRFEFECPVCGYETIMWECPELDYDTQSKPELPVCPECPPPPEGPDGIPIIPSEHADVDDVPGAIDARDAMDELTDVAGVGETKAMSLINAGYYSKEDLRRATQSEFAEVEDWGNALAARVKADVGDVSDTELILTEVRLEADADH